MRKVIVSNMVTLDGLFAGPNGEIDWHRVNDEFFKDAIELLGAVDTLLFGRVTYLGMASYWPTPQASQDDPVIAGQMNSRHKLVFSRTLERADWNNSTLVKDDVVQAIPKLKQQPGKDMVIFGSGDIVSALTPHSLIDEYRLYVVPAILGSGKPLFQGISNQVNLKLLATKSYQNGVVLLTYAPEKS